MRVSVRDLHIRTSELIRAAESGEVVVIERRGEPVVELRAIDRKPQPPLPDMSEIWNTFPQVSGDSTQYISEDRDR